MRYKTHMVPERYNSDIYCHHATNWMPYHLTNEWLWCLSIVSIDQHAISEFNFNFLLADLFRLIIFAGKYNKVSLYWLVLWSEVAWGCKNLGGVILMTYPPFPLCWSGLWWWVKFGIYSYGDNTILSGGNNYALWCNTLRRWGFGRTAVGSEDSSEVGGSPGRLYFLLGFVWSELQWRVAA